MFASSLCESQVTAAVACFALLLVDYLLTTLAGYVPSGVGSAALLVVILAILAFLVYANLPFTYTQGPRARQSTTWL